MSSEAHGSSPDPTSLRDVTELLCKLWSDSPRSERLECLRRLETVGLSQRVALPPELCQNFQLPNTDSLSPGDASKLLGDIIQRLNDFAATADKAYASSFDKGGRFLDLAGCKSKGLKGPLARYLETGDLQAWKSDLGEALALFEALSMGRAFAGASRGATNDRNVWQSGATSFGQALELELAPEAFKSDGREGWFGSARLWKRFRVRYEENLRDAATIADRVLRVLGLAIAEQVVQTGKWPKGKDYDAALLRRNQASNDYQALEATRRKNMRAEKLNASQD